MEGSRGAGHSAPTTKKIQICPIRMASSNDRYGVSLNGNSTSLYEWYRFDTCANFVVSFSLQSVYIASLDYFPESDDLEGDIAPASYDDMTITANGQTQVPLQGAPLPACITPSPSRTVRSNNGVAASLHSYEVVDGIATHNCDATLSRFLFFKHDLDTRSSRFSVTTIQQ